MFDNLSPIGKLFFGGMVAWITNNSKFNFKVRGDQSKVNALTNAIIATKNYNDVLKSENPTIQEVLDKLNTKSVAVKQFEEIMGNGFRFPL